MEYLSLLLIVFENWADVENKRLWRSQKIA